MNQQNDGPVSSSEEQVHELVAEFHRLEDRGQVVSPTDFVAQHPEHADALKSYFDGVAAVDQMSDPPPAPEQTFVTGNTQAIADDQTMIEDSASVAANQRVSADAPPTQFGRYKILSELGRGAMGAVYLAQDEQLDRKVALKIPQFGGALNSGLLERFYREARAAGNLRHSGICPVFDVGEIDGQHFITMAFIEGRPLRDFSKSSKRQADKQTARVIRKIAMAMAEAHDQNVIHRDLKPANIMIDTKNEPVVMDFGLARRATENEEKLTHTGTVIGTPAYMSPEQVDGDNENVGPPADIYSLGVIFYELLTGELPFKGNLMSILKQISMKQPRPPVELHAETDPFLQNLCLKMLEKDAKARPESMHEVAQSLSEWLQGLHAPTDESGMLETSRVPGQKKNKAPALEATGAMTTPGVQRTEPQPEEFPAVEEFPVVVDTEMSATTVTSSRPAASADKPPGKNKKLLTFGALGGAAILLAGITFFFNLGGKYDVKITVEDSSISLKVDGEDVLIGGSGVAIRLSAGPHKLIVERDGFEAETDEFTVKKDGKTAVHVAIVGGKLSFFKDGQRPGKIVGAKWVSESPSPSSTVKPATPELAHGLSFADKGSRVELPDLPIDYAKPFAVEMWCKLAPQPVNQYRILFAVGNFQFRIVPKSGLPNWAAMLGGPRKAGWVRSAAYRSFDDSHPTHILYQWTGNSIDCWIDGKRIDFKTVSYGDMPKPGTAAFQALLNASRTRGFSIGNDNANTANSIQGTIWSTNFYQGIIVDQDKFDVHSLPQSNAKTIASYNFDEGSGDILKDSSGNGHDGKIVGAKWVKSSPQSPPEGQTASVSLVEMLTSLDYEWTEPVNLGPLVNSHLHDGGPELSADGRTLIYHSKRDGGQGSFDLWMSKRDAPDQPFGQPVNMGPVINSGENDCCPALSADGRTLIFARGEFFSQGLWMSTRNSTSEPFGQPVNMGPVINFENDNRHPELYDNGRTLIYGAKRQGDGGLWRSTRTSRDQPFGKPQKFGIAIKARVYNHTLTTDGRTLLFSSSQLSGEHLGLPGLWLSARKAEDRPFGSPIKLGIKSGEYDAEPCLSADGRTLIFASRRPGGHGLDDLWTSRLVRKAAATLGKPGAVNRSSTGANAPPSAMAPSGSTTLPNGWVIEPPVNLGPVVNSDGRDGGPTLSGDGRLLIFHSDRPGGQGGYDLWMSKRDAPDAPFGEPVNMGPVINSGDDDWQSSLSTDGRTLIFVRRGPDSHNLWMSTRSSPDEPFGQPVSLRTVNSGENNSSPDLSDNGRTLVFCSKRNGKLCLLVATRGAAGEPFGQPERLEITFGMVAEGPSISSDGRTLIFHSRAVGSHGDADFYLASRAKDGAPFDSPFNMGSVVNTAKIDAQPCLSADGRTLIFESNRPGGQANLDLWMARIRRPGDIDTKQQGDETTRTTPPPASAPFDAAAAKAHQVAWAKHLGETVETTNSIGMEF